MDLARNRITQMVAFQIALEETDSVSISIRVDTGQAAAFSVEPTSWLIISTITDLGSG